MALSRDPFEELVALLDRALPGQVGYEGLPSYDATVEYLDFLLYGQKDPRRTKSPRVAEFEAYLERLREKRQAATENTERRDGDAPTVAATGGCGIRRLAIERKTRHGVRTGGSRVQRAQRAERSETPSGR